MSRLFLAWPGRTADRVPEEGAARAKGTSGGAAERYGRPSADPQEEPVMKPRSASPVAGRTRRPLLGMSLALGVAAALTAGVPGTHPAVRTSAAAAPGLRVAAAARPAGTWRLLPRAPAGAMPSPGFTVSVWTGRQMIVWGGYSNATPGKALTDGAVYTPAR